MLALICTLFIILGTCTYPDSCYGSYLRKWSRASLCCRSSDCEFLSRCPDYRSDDARHRRDEGDADAVSGVLGDWADRLPEDGGSSEQNRSPSGGQETKCH